MNKLPELVVAELICKATAELRKLSIDTYLNDGILDKGQTAHDHFMVDDGEVIIEQS